jgi:5-methylthioadenosine/S-adenosylhomocysteine deaminase
MPATTEFDVLIRGGHVLTLNTANTEYKRGAVGVRDGHIAWVSAEPIPAGVTAAITIDAEGCVVLPTFVNAHTHLAMTLFRGLADDMDLQRFLAVLTKEETRVLTADSVRGGAEVACLESLLAGTGAALDMYWFDQQAAAAGRKYGVQVETGPAFADFDTPERLSFEEKLAKAEEQLAAHPAGAPGAPWVMPHGTYTLTEPRLTALGELSQRYGARVHVHASENAREVADVQRLHGARPIEVLHRTGLLTERTVVAHAVELTDSDIALLASTGASVAHCPWSNLKLAAGVAPVTALLDAGVTVALGTDGAVSSNSLEMWSALRLAASVHKWREKDPAAVGARTVVRMATASGAAALGLDDLGSLEPGKRATLQVVRLDGTHHFGPGDVWSSLAYSARPSDVRDVLIDGVVVVRAGALAT